MTTAPSCVCDVICFDDDAVLRTIDLMRKASDRADTEGVVTSG